MQTRRLQTRRLHCSDLSCLRLSRVPAPKRHVCWSRASAGCWASPDRVRPAGKARCDMRRSAPLTQTTACYGRTSTAVGWECPTCMRSPPALLCVCVCAPVKDHALAACVTRKGHAQLAEVCSVTELHALRAAREQAVRTANAVTAREHNLGALSTQPLFLRDRDQAHATARVDARQGQCANVPKDTIRWAIRLMLAQFASVGGLEGAEYRRQCQLRHTEHLNRWRRRRMRANGGPSH